jgi:sensor domain CHASE-containing protein
MDIKPKLNFKQPEIWAIAGINCAFLYVIPKILEFYVQIRLPFLLGIVIALQVSVLLLSLRLFRGYEQRSWQNGLHTAAADTHKTMEQMTTIMQLTLEAQKQLLKVTQELKGVSPYQSPD